MLPADGNHELHSGSPGALRRASRFIVIGGVAGNLHGSALVTFDLDICFSRDSANLRRIVGVLSPFHPRLRDFPADLPFIWDEKTLQNGTVFTLKTDMGPIDLLAEVKGLGSFDDLKKMSVPIAIGGSNILALDLPALIHSKKAAGRAKDLLAIPELESLLEVSE